MAAGTDDSNGDLDLALWRSKNAARWDRVEGLAVEGTDETVSRATNTPFGLVVAGSRTAQGGDGEDAAVWIFAKTLEPVAPVSDADLGGQGDQRISRVLAMDEGAGGGLLELGYADGDAGVWTSEDGL